MKFFKPDLYRQLVIGFFIGTALVVAANAENWVGDLAPAAQAAPNLRAGHDLVAPTAEFLIEQQPSQGAR